ncbi:WXG100 family type VII secretion target [Saccharopolyspora sp. NPDC000359]|uniref:WXG100 family type VII secretion target n=1 Tax=Saccharopolyspora sp. NPDC000359 TaxID=3154251 RepID=UPI00332DE215
MDRFTVRYAAIGEAWESVRDATSQIRTKLVDLDTSLGPLRATWTGEAAESFEAARATWAREAAEMTEFLADMADLLALIDENYQSAHHQNLAISDAATGSADPTATVAMSAGGTAGEVDVSIEELRRTARSFYGLQQQLADNMAWISRNLHANATGMAGADPVLAPWRNLMDSNNISAPHHMMLGLRWMNPTTPESVHITPERMGHILEGDPPPSTGGRTHVRNRTGRKDRIPQGVGREVHLGARPRRGQASGQPTH